MFEPPMYGTRLVDAGLEIRLKSPVISEMVLWEWEIQEPRKVEEWRLPGRAPAVRTPQPGEWTDRSNPEVERCRWRHARADGPNLTTAPQMARFRQQPQPQRSFYNPGAMQFWCEAGRGVIWERAEPGWCGGIFLGGSTGMVATTVSTKNVFLR